MTNFMQVDTSSLRDMVLTRVFDAPRALVWECWTDPEHMAAWWGPKGFTNRCELDVRPGGKQFITMVAPDGKEYPITAVYLDVELGKKLVSSTHPEDWRDQSADLAGRRTDGQLKLIMTVTFEDVGDKKTLVTVTQTFANAAERDTNMKMGAESGWRESFVKLDALLESTLTSRR